MHALSRLNIVVALVAALQSAAPAQDASGGAKTRLVEERSLSIYSDVPVGDAADARSETERYYEPYYFSPAAKASQIVADASVPASQADEDAEGTFVEVSVRWTGPNEFATVGFVPAGATRLGQLPGRNIAETLGDASGHKVYLRFRARRPAGDPEVKAKFRVGGLAGNPHRDSQKFPVGTKPELVTLGETWTDFSVDCSSADLSAVLCPLSVTLESKDNPFARKKAGSSEPVSTVYIDDVRFVAVRAATQR